MCYSFIISCYFSIYEKFTYWEDRFIFVDHTFYYRPWFFKVTNIFFEQAKTHLHISDLYGIASHGDTQLSHTFLLWNP